MSAFPYHGLRPFNRDETDIFFGREQHTDELITRLSKQNFLAVVGFSGCGKSSLVRTGLIPSLQAGFLAGAGTHWHVAEFRPSNQPFENLAEALADDEALGERYRTALVNNKILKRGSLSLHELLAIKPLPNKSKLLIVCDQFEEIFRYYKQDQGVQAEAEAFIKLLLASCLSYRLPDDSKSRDVYVVLTMRSDFLGDCALFPGLAEAINNGLYLTPLLTNEQLQEAIEEPAHIFGGEIEPSLVVQLLEETNKKQDLLPLLQHLLMVMWNLAVKEKSKKNGVIIVTPHHYKQVGGLDNALSLYVDNIFSQLTIEQQRLTKILFKTLTERNEQNRDIRRPTLLKKILDLAKNKTRKDILRGIGINTKFQLIKLLQTYKWKEFRKLKKTTTWQEIEKIITIFRQEGCNFILPALPKEIDQESVIDISHESLIRQWKRLQKWVENESDSEKMYSRLEDRAILWQQGKANLLTGSELQFFKKWFEKNEFTKIRKEMHSENFLLTRKFLNKSKSKHSGVFIKVIRLILVGLFILWIIIAIQ